MIEKIGLTNREVDAINNAAIGSFITLDCGLTVQKVSDRTGEGVYMDCEYCVMEKLRSCDGLHCLSEDWVLLPAPPHMEIASREAKSVGDIFKELIASLDKALHDQKASAGTVAEFRDWYTRLSAEMESNNLKVKGDSDVN